MMTPTRMMEFVAAEPFQPFRIHMASGRNFEVRHPEMISVGRSTATVHLRPEDVSDPSDRLQVLSLMLMESVEPLVSQTLAGSH